MGKLANKVAVVTGALKGIGAGIAKHFVAEGDSVVVNYSTSKEVDAITKSLAKDSRRRKIRVSNVERTNTKEAASNVMKGEIEKEGRVCRKK